MLAAGAPVSGALPEGAVDFLLTSGNLGWKDGKGAVFADGQRNQERLRKYAAGIGGECFSSVSGRRSDLLHHHFQRFTRRAISAQRDKAGAVAVKDAPERGAVGLGQFKSIDCSP